MNHPANKPCCTSYLMSQRAAARDAEQQAEGRWTRRTAGSLSSALIRYLQGAPWRLGGAGGGHLRVHNPLAVLRGQSSAPGLHPPSLRMYAAHSSR